MYKKLFIIGNGFDLAHGLPTTYEDFHEYLKREYDGSEITNGFLPDVYMSPDGGMDCSDEAAVEFLRNISSEVNPDDNKWCNFESTLGKLNFGEYLDDTLDEELASEKGKEYHVVYRNQDIAASIFQIVRRINIYFEDWINTIVFDKIESKKDIENLFNGINLILSFNYTETIETLYNIDVVHHIHGVQHQNIIMGHGNDADQTDFLMAKYIGAEDDIMGIIHFLRKDTRLAMKNNKEFFNALSNDIDKIYSFGFSFSEVDLIYIREICSKINTSNVTWYLNDYDSKSVREEYNKIIRKCGYSGKFDIFHTD